MEYLLFKEQQEDTVVRGVHEVKEVRGTSVCGTSSATVKTILTALKPGREPVPTLQGKGAHTTMLILPPASLDLVDGSIEEVAESGCDGTA